MSTEFDVAIIGAGPAGLAAALTLKQRGVERIAVLERETEAGGIPRHCGHRTFGLAEFGWPMTGPAYARRLVQRAEAAGIAVRTRVTVLALNSGGELATSHPDSGSAAIRARRILIATGVRETPRAARLVGGSRPVGVLTTGALQNFIYLHGKAPFTRPVVIGTELVSFSALLTCRHAGIRPQAMIEMNDQPTASALFAVYPRLRGIPLRYNTKLIAIEGTDRVSGIIVEDVSGKRETITCDGVLFTGQFVPASELVRQGPFDLDPATGGPAVDQYGRLSDPTYYAAGNVLRPVETSGWCYGEGRSAGHVIADDLAGKLLAPHASVAIACGPGLKYVMPQRLAPGGSEHMHGALQLRVDHPVRGRLTLQAEGREVWSKPVSLRPERRFLLPLTLIEKHRSAAALRLSIETA